MINKTTLEKYIETLNSIYEEFSTTKKASIVLNALGNHIKVRREDVRSNSKDILYLEHWEKEQDIWLTASLQNELIELTKSELSSLTNDVDIDSFEDKDIFIDNIEWLKIAVERSNELIENWRK